MQAPDIPSFRVGDWLVDPPGQTISQEGEEKRLEPRIMHVLICLAERRGDVISRNELLDAVWADVVVNEDALTRAVSDLRIALGDDPNEAKYVETVRGRGYRLVAPVTSAKHSTTTWRLARAAISGRIGLVAAGILIGAVVVTAGWFLLNSNHEGAADVLTSTPFTSFAGYEIDPSLSPDGNRVAYAWTDNYWEEEFDLYVKQVGSEVPLQITNMDGFEASPAWSPDGSTIAFAGFHEGSGSIYTVPSLGGPARKVADANSWVYGLDWSPDGAHIVFAERGADAGLDFHLELLAIDSGRKRGLTVPPTSGHRDHSPTFSPNGRYIAFVRNSPTGGGDVVVLNVDGGTPRRLTHLHARIYGLDWSEDGNAIVFASHHPGISRLWRVGPDGGGLEQIPTTARAIMGLTLASGRLVFEEKSSEDDIHRIKVRGGADSKPHPVASSTQWDGEPSLSPDGTRLAFASSRHGDVDLWIADSGGANPYRLTSMGNLPLARPRWAPDGQTLAFNASIDGIESIYKVDSRGGRPEPVFAASSNAVVTSWSADGNWIYFASDRTGDWQIWKIRPDGGEASHVTTNGGFSARETPDGRFLLYTKSADHGLWRQPIAGGDEEKILDQPKRWLWDSWDLLDDGVLYVEYANDQATVKWTSLSKDSTGVLADLPPQRAHSSVSISPDGRMLYFATERMTGSDLYFMEGLP